MQKIYGYLFLTLALSVVAFSTPRSVAADQASKDPYHKYFGESTYLDLSTVFYAISEEELLPDPPRKGSLEAMEDEEERSQVYNETENEEIVKAVHEEDGIFSFSSVLGADFNAEELPKTKHLFKDIYNDSHLATDMAKLFFKRPRPMRNDGYAYPSAHSTRAFVWGSLLATIFTDEETKTALENKAWEKAWDRVILGRHYPKDVEAGKIYGEYLCNQFLQNPKFVKKWDQVVEEIKEKMNVAPNEERDFNKR